MAGLVGFTSDMTPALAEWVRLDIIEMGHAWAKVTGRPRFRATLSVVSSDQCRKLHTDNVDLRALCTYVGAGTLLLPEPAVDRGALGDARDASEANREICRDEDQLVRARSGDIVFMKGRRWRGGARGAIHRSPTIEADGGRRLVLKVDGIDCD